MRSITIDIETQPQDHEELLTTFRPQFEPPSNYKDPEKIQAYIVDAEKRWVESSALHAERGRVLAIGYKFEGHSAQVFDAVDEKDILSEFFGILESATRSDDFPVSFEVSEPHTVCGFNILNFDLPFLRRRALILGVPFPFYTGDKWNPWSFKVFDAAVSWQCGDRSEYVKQDVLLRAFGIGKKPYDGALFHQLYSENPESALAMLREEVTMTETLCQRLQ